MATEHRQMQVTPDDAAVAVNPGANSFVIVDTPSRVSHCLFDTHWANQGDKLESHKMLHHCEAQAAC